MSGMFKCPDCGLEKISKRDRDKVTMPCICGTIMVYTPDREK